MEGEGREPGLSEAKTGQLVGTWMILVTKVSAAAIPASLAKLVVSAYGGGHPYLIPLPDEVEASSHAEKPRDAGVKRLARVH